MIYFNAALTDVDFSLDIAPYSHFVKIGILNNELIYKDSLYKIDYKNEQLNITRINDSTSPIVINLKAKIADLSQEELTNYTVSQLSMEGQDYKMVIVRVDAQINPSKLATKLNYFEGFLFLK